MKHLLLIGLDPGQNTGLAVYDPGAGRLLRCETLSFWEAQAAFVGALVPVGDGGDVGLVVIEDARELPIYARHRKQELTREARDRLCRGVGHVDRDTELWSEWLRLAGYRVQLVPPPRPSRFDPSRSRKWTAEDLERITGWTEPTSEHARDAARLVWRRTLHPQRETV